MMKRGPQQVDAALGLSPRHERGGKATVGTSGDAPWEEDSVQGHLCPGPSSFFDRK